MEPVLSKLQHCNNELSTGEFVSAEFTEKEMAKNYTTHLNDIQRWADMNKNVVDKLRHKWFTRAMYVLSHDIL
jgi:hypothetical protein